MSVYNTLAAICARA